jgi:hypothetical protein
MLLLHILFDSFRHLGPTGSAVSATTSEKAQSVDFNTYQWVNWINSDSNSSKNLPAYDHHRPHHLSNIIVVLVCPFL